MQLSDVLSKHPDKGYKQIAGFLLNKNIVSIDCELTCSCGTSAPA